MRVLAGTAFARAGEVEETLETLCAGSNRENLEACVGPSWASSLSPRRVTYSRVVLQGRRRRAGLPLHQPP